MILTMQADGTLLTTVPERVFQGSNNANTIAVVGDIARTNSMVIAFKLPQSGVWTTPVEMTLADNIDESTGFNVWSILLEEAITQEYGSVELQVKSINAAGEVIASALGSFVVERGVPPTIPVTLTTTVYEQILANIQDIRADLNTMENNIETINNTIPNKQDKLSAGNGITLTDNTVAIDENVVQHKLVAGANITIDESTNTISSVDTGKEYTGSNGVVIEDTVIKLDPNHITVSDDDGVTLTQSKDNKTSTVVLTSVNSLLASLDETTGDQAVIGVDPTRIMAQIGEDATNLAEPVIAGDNVTITKEGTQYKISAAGGELPTNLAKTDEANVFTKAQTINSDLTVTGNLYQNGEAYETHAEKVYSKNDNIVLRDGATNSLGSEYSGLQINKYNGTDDLRLVAGADGVARVGKTGDEQPLATREETPVANGIAYWDVTNKRYATSSNIKVQSGDNDNLVVASGPYQRAIVNNNGLECRNGSNYWSRLYFSSWSMNYLDQYSIFTGTGYESYATNYSDPLYTKYDLRYVTVQITGDNLKTALTISNKLNLSRAYLVTADSADGTYLAGHLYMIGGSNGAYTTTDITPLANFIKTNADGVLIDNNPTVTYMGASIDLGYSSSQLRLTYQGNGPTYLDIGSYGATLTNNYGSQRKTDLLTPIVAGDGITVTKDNSKGQFTVGADTSVLQKKLVAGTNITIDETTNTISSIQSGGNYLGANGVVIDGATIKLDPDHFAVSNEAITAKSANGTTNLLTPVIAGTNITIAKEGTQYKISTELPYISVSKTAFSGDISLSQEQADILIDSPDAYIRFRQKATGSFPGAVKTILLVRVIDDSPTNNGIKYCSFCGGTLYTCIFYPSSLVLTLLTNDFAETNQLAAYTPTTRTICGIDLVNNISASELAGGVLTGNVGYGDKITAINLTANPAYIKFESGLQILWYVGTSRLNDFQSITVTIPAFASASYAVTLGSLYQTDDGAYNNALMVQEQTSTTIKLYARGNKDGGRYPYFIAIGKWK